MIAVHPNMKPVMTGTVTIFLIANKQVLKRWLKVQVLNGKIRFSHTCQINVSK